MSVPSRGSSASLSANCGRRARCRGPPSPRALPGTGARPSPGRAPCDRWQRCGQRAREGDGSSVSHHDEPAVSRPPAGPCGATPNPRTRSQRRWLRSAGAPSARARRLRRPGATSDDTGPSRRCRPSRRCAGSARRHAVLQTPPVQFGSLRAEMACAPKTEPTPTETRPRPAETYARTCCVPPHWTDRRFRAPRGWRSGASTRAPAWTSTSALAPRRP